MEKTLTIIVAFGSVAHLADVNAVVDGVRDLDLDRAVGWHVLADMDLADPWLIQGHGHWGVSWVLGAGKKWQLHFPARVICAGQWCLSALCLQA